MQKLLRRAPPPLLLCSSSPPNFINPPPNFISFSPFSTTKLSPNFSPGLISAKPVNLIMPTASTALHLRPSIGLLPNSTASIRTSSSSLSRTSFIRRAAVGSSGGGCRCSTEAQRPWVVLKEMRRGGSRLAWVHNAAGSAGEGGNDSESEESDVEEEEREGGEEVSNTSGSSKEEEEEEENKEARIQRRRRRAASGSVGGGVLRNPDLLTIPGVGPRNLRKLVEKGIGGVAELKQLYRDKFFGKSSQNMVEYLQTSVGIIHRNHATSITTYIKKSVDEELQDDGSSAGSRKNRITLCVEGNISVGKTTFLKRIANETLELRDLVEVVPEPIDKWQDIGADHFNILDAFYAEPQRYAYTFQNYVFVTRVMQERDSSGGIQPLRLMERSVFSDRMVFVRAVHEAKWMSEMEISIYDSWFDPVVSCLPGLIPDGFIYLRASPDTCHKRMMLRKRDEEGGVSLDYLRGLHEKHESWLLPSESGNHGVLSVSKLPFHMDSSMHPDIRDRVYYLEGPQMHSSIQKVPALVLDCDADIDFNRDIEAKSHYARQVAEFFEFVKKKKEAEPLKPGGEAGKQQVILPQNGGLWVPDGKNFPESALQNLDLRRAMSFVPS